MAMDTIGHHWTPPFLVPEIQSSRSPALRAEAPVVLEGEPISSAEGLAAALSLSGGHRRLGDPGSDGGGNHGL